MKLLLSFNQIILETFSSGFIIAICSSLSNFTNSKFILFGLFYLALSGNDCVLLTILYIDMPFIYLSSFEPYLQQYLNAYLLSISGNRIRVLRIVVTLCLRLVFKPYLIRVWPVQNWNEWKTVCQSISVDPTVSVSCLYPLPNSLRTSDSKIQLSNFVI